MNATSEESPRHHPQDTFSPEHDNSHPPEAQPLKSWTYTQPSPPPKAPLLQDTPDTHQNKKPQSH